MSGTPGGGRGEQPWRRLLERCRYAEPGALNGNCEGEPRPRPEVSTDFKRPECDDFGAGTVM